MRSRLSSLLSFTLFLIVMSASFAGTETETPSPVSATNLSTPQLHLGYVSDTHYTGDFFRQTLMLHSPHDFRDDTTTPAFMQGAVRANGSYYSPTVFFELQRLFNPPAHDDDWESSRFEIKAALAYPLLSGRNGPQLLLRPLGDIYGSYGKRLALRRLQKLPAIETPSGELSLDLHVHTCYSHDSFADVSQMIQIAARRGLSGIAITDHNTMDGVPAAIIRAERLKKENRIPASFLIIPGEEISSTNGHIVALFISHLIEPGKSAKETVDSIHAQGGLAIAAHPELSDGVGALAKTLPFDAVESQNAAEKLRFAYKKAQAAERRDAFYADIHKPLLGVTDAHDPGAIGVCYTRVKAAPDLDSVKAALLAGQTTPVARLTDDELRADAHNGFNGALLAFGRSINVKTFDFSGWMNRMTGASATHLWLWPHPQLFWAKSF